MSKVEVELVGEDAGMFDVGNEKMGEFIGGDGAVERNWLT